mgnify:CR=1 FL=1
MGGRRLHLPGMNLKYPRITLFLSWRMIESVPALLLHYFIRLDDTGDEDMDIPLADSPFLLWAYGGNGDVIEIDDNDYEFG